MCIRDSRSVQHRVLLDFRLKKEGCDLPRSHPSVQAEEEPLRAFIHGPPGTGKSKVIRWVIRMFTEALKWENGIDFICLAFQNRVAYAMNGTTLHTGGGIAVGQQRDTNLNHTDIDVLFTRNQHLRWLLIDEVGMIPDDLLGQLSTNLTDAATKTRYLTRFDKTIRSFGGYNVLTFGDMYQIPPIPIHILHLHSTSCKGERTWKK